MSTGQISETQQPKEKVKTRGQSVKIDANSRKPDQETETDSPTTSLNQPQFLHVKGETVRVLSRLFPSEAEEHAAKPLDWKSFVIALEDCGFTASTSGGSAVIFTKAGEGRIVFHRPHPIPKIDQDLLQGWGKRMNKWFGWERETFVDKKLDSAS
ncbi:hypothetical protein VTL71DRAFT_15607 [Oculimacula yallundae]|uniref:Uncharacterized protein n=1 Tax=Oculimacula yallundae TaxID=86028 RepID=A0ABR4CHN7_9HELO